MNFSANDLKSYRANELSRGQSTLEILIALAILTIALSTIIVVAVGNQSVSVDTENSHQALYLAQENLEDAKVMAKADFSSLVTSTSTSGIYTNTITATDITLYKKQVVSTVTWQTDPLRVQKVELATIISDAGNIGGDDGGGGLTGDWRNPHTLGSVDLGPGNSATGLDVINKIIFMSAEASAAAKPDFFIVNATDGQSPFIVSSLNTGPSLNAVDAALNYAYVANASTSSQLQIIDISNQASPTVSASFQLPGVSGPGAIGKSIFYYDSKIYIGTDKATGPEFHIVDVSDPSFPVSLGSFEANADVNAIMINGTKAYITTSDDIKEMRILDVSNLAGISELSNYNGAGGNDGKGLWLVNTNLFLGRLVGDKELTILNIAMPETIQEIGSVEVNADVNALYVRDYLAFSGTTDSNKEFQIWNISDPSDIIFWSSLNFPQVLSDMDYEDNIIYAAVRSNDALRIITSQ